MPKFVFSALYAESVEFFPFFVDNFQRYTDAECVLIVNSNKPLMLGERFHEHGRVHVQFGSPRKAWGATLLNGHIENFDYAVKVLADFDWFITVASNSLFFRTFDQSQAVAKAEAEHNVGPQVHWNSLPSEWHWPNLSSFQDAAKRLQEHWQIHGLNGGQIEGYMARRPDWAMVANVLKDTYDLWAGLAAPLEEILPVSVIQALGSGKTASICHVNWTLNGRAGKNLVELRDLVRPEHLEPHICMQKWFRRSAVAPETYAVTTPLGWAILDALQLCQDEVMAGALDALLSASSLAIKEKFFKKMHFNLMASSWECSVKAKAQRQLISLEAGTSAETPFLFLEDTGEDISIDISKQASGSITISANRLGSDRVDAVPQLQGYLYFPVFRPSVEKDWLFYLSGRVELGDAALMLSSVVLKRGEQFTIIEPLTKKLSDGIFQAHFQVPGGASPCCVGLPVFSDSMCRVDIWS